jgi:hypothetical protein
MKKTPLAVVGHIGPEPRGRRMSVPHALAAFAALGQPTRLGIFRLLMAAEPGGLAAGTTVFSRWAGMVRYSDTGRGPCASK